jgi:serine/threonine protein phosphatase 1
MIPHLDESRRIIAVGDIHGCINSLRALLAKLDLRPDDQLVFLGDYIDRGPASKEVVTALIALGERYTCQFLMGNHEQMYLDYLETGDSDLWYSNGGSTTLQSYNCKEGTGLPPEHIDFFRQCSYYSETASYFFTHGGLDPDLTIRDNLKYYDPSDFCRLRVHMRRSYLEAAAYPWEKTLVCAHTPVPLPIVKERLIAIDTGCVYKSNPMLGKLSAVILPSRAIWQTINSD